MKKYIVKNCPACLPMTKLCDSENMEKVGMYCWDCTDCKIKQVIELCRDVDCDIDYQNEKCWKCPKSGAKFMSEKILQLFEIEECE